MIDKELFNRLFKSDIEDQLDKIDADYLDIIFENEELTYITVLQFIEQHENEIISSSLKDNALIEVLLTDGFTVDMTKKELIKEDYLKELINRIKYKKYNKNTITFFLYIVKIYNLYNDKYDSDTIKEILNTNMLSIVENTNLVSNNGDSILSKEKKLELTDKLLSWNKKCGTTILPYIFLLEELKKNILILTNSNQVNNDYKEKLEVLLKICDYSILVRDTDIIPTKEEIEQINNLFNNYDSINKKIILDKLAEEDLLLVHFVRDNEVNYQLVGNGIMDMSDNSSNSFDKRQADFFVKSYCQYIISKIEEETNSKFDINNPKMRELVKRYLENYNDTINNRPLDRLPIKKREKSRNFKDYIRGTDSRLSCSLISNKNIRSHLDRKIGLILRPRGKHAILSTSLGYTSEKSFYDFRNDSTPCTEIFKQINNGVNETCVDANECDVVGVIVLSTEKEVLERARRIADAYHTEVIDFSNKKTLI